MLKKALVIFMVSAIVTPASAVNYLLKVGECFKPVVYPIEAECQAAGGALSGSPTFECVPYNGNMLPPPIDSMKSRVCPKE